MYRDNFKQREFGCRNVFGYFTRHLQFEDHKQMQQYFIDNIPDDVTNGAIFTTFKSYWNDFVIDIDINDYYSLLKCCNGSSICKFCVDYLMINVVKPIHLFLTERLNLTQIVWTFSGRRGFHCRVMDRAV